MREKKQGPVVQSIVSQLVYADFIIKYAVIFVEKMLVQHFFLVNKK